MADTMGKPTTPPSPTPPPPHGSLKTWDALQSHTEPICAMTLAASCQPKAWLSFLENAIPLPTVAVLPVPTVMLWLWGSRPGTGILCSRLGSATALPCDLGPITHAPWFWFPLRPNGAVDDQVISKGPLLSRVHAMVFASTRQGKFRLQRPRGQGGGTA